MTDDDDRDAFGYRPITAPAPISVQVSEGKNSGTLEPRVMIAFRMDLDEPQVTYSLSVDQADDVADELKRWAARAREKHFE